jgi:hypothetical protein
VAPCEECNDRELYDLRLSFQRYLNRPPKIPKKG